MPPGPPGDPEADYANIADLQEDGDLREDLEGWFYTATKEAITVLGNQEITVVVGAFAIGGRNLGMRSVLSTDPQSADPEALTTKVVAFLADTFPGNGFQGQVQIALVPKGKKNPVVDPWGTLLSIGQKALSDPNAAMGVGWGQPPAGWGQAPQQLPQQFQAPVPWQPQPQQGWGPPNMGQPPMMPQQPQMNPMQVVQGPNGQPMYYWQYQQMMGQMPGQMPPMGGGMPTMPGGGGRGGPPGMPGMPHGGHEDDGGGEPFDFGGGDDGLGGERQDWTTAMLSHQQAIQGHQHDMRQTELNAGLSEREMTWNMMRWFADRMASQSERAMIISVEAMKTARSMGSSGLGGGDGEPASRWDKVKQLAEIAVEGAAGVAMDRLGFEDEADTSSTAPAIPSAPPAKQLRAPRKEAPTFQPPERREVFVERDEDSGQQEYSDDDTEGD